LEHIFKIQHTGSHVIVRELGFANICMGTLGILSLFFIQFRLAAAITGGLYFGLAGLVHIFRKPESKNENLAMGSDIFIFIIVLFYVLYSIIK
jgi:hypothetical protein